jgi:Zn-dependent M28 family amino/carboxypeptidase
MPQYRDILRAAQLWLLAVVSSVLLAACASQSSSSSDASDARAASKTSLTIDQANYVKLLQEISSDEMAGRGPGAVGEKRVVPYMIEQFKQLGLAPGPDGSYTQAVPMVEIRGEITTPVRLNNDTQVRELKPLEDFVIGSRLLQPEVALDNLEMVFVGYGVVAPEAGWNDYAGLDVKGKVVVMFINDPGFHQQDATLFNGKAMTYYGRWTYKFEEAARQGAAAALIIHDDAGAAYGWEVVRNSWSGPAFDLDSALASKPVSMQGWLSDAASRRLLADSGIELERARDAAGKPGFRGQPLTTRFSAALKNQIRKGSSDNVIGVLPGKSRADEVVLICAHWDHLGQSFGLPDGIYNGTIDNGTGVAGIFEMARAIKAQGGTERSIVFLLVTLEESGLLGSRYYAEHPLFPLKKTVGMINMDAIQLVGKTRDMVVVGFGASELEQLFEAELKNQGRVMRPEESPEHGSFYRSDHFNFAKVGVPALYPKNGLDHVEHGIAHGKAITDAYGKDDYHKPSDQFRDDLDFSSMPQDLGAIAGVIVRLANSDAWPNWYQGNEFRATRDASLQAKGE